MTKYRNGKKKRPGPYDATKKTTNDDNSTSEVATEQLSDSECENCKIESDTLVQCEKCKLWLCCDCQCISPNMLKAIKQFDSLHWFCKSCEPNIQEVLQPKSTHPEIIQKNVECRLQTMESQLAKLTSNISALTSSWEERKASFQSETNASSFITSTASPNQMALRIVDEYKDHESRKMNLIFHKVPESEQADPVAKHDHDKKFVFSVAKELGIEGLEVINSARIGRTNESGERLLKVKVNNLYIKKQILSKAKTLRQVKDDKISKVYITPDLSYQERLHQKSLRSELHRRRNAGETNLIIRKGQIVTRQVDQMETSHPTPAAAPNNNR